jgi:hypothetical protein
VHHGVARDFYYELSLLMSYSLSNSICIYLFPGVYKFFNSNR